jgi:hypothetical protein
MLPLLLLLLNSLLAPSLWPNVNNSKALVATYCDSVLAGKNGGKHIGNDVGGDKEDSFCEVRSLGKNVQYMYIFVKITQSLKRYLMGINFGSFFMETVLNSKRSVIT